MDISDGDFTRDYPKKYPPNGNTGFFSVGEEYDMEEDAEEEDDNPETFEVLRNELLSRLQTPQFTSKLKSQIRAALALQLTPGHILTAQPPGIIAAPDPFSDLSNAVVAQHLLTSGCDFSLSVFLPESGLNGQVHPMNLTDLMRLLRIRHDKVPAGRGTEKAEQKSLLNYLIERLPVRLNGEVGVFDDGSKVAEKTIIPRNGIREDVLKERMQMLEVQRRMGWQSGEPFDVNVAFDRFQTQLETSLRISLRDDITRLHTIEINQLIDEEKSRHSRELLSVTATWESRLREQHAIIEGLHQRLHGAEQETFTQRQDLLRQYELFTQREQKLRHAEEEHQRDCQAKEAELIQRAKQLAEVGQTLQNKDTAIDKIVDGKVDEQLIARSKSLDEREDNIRKEEISLLKLKEHLTRTVLSDDGELSLTEPKPFLQKIKSEFSRLHRENQQLKNKVAGLANYEDMKKQVEDFDRENKRFRRQIDSLNAELVQERQEHTTLVKDMTEKLVVPEKEIGIVRREADALKEKLLLETLSWENERTRLKSAVKEKTREVDGQKSKVAQLQEKVELLNGKLSRMQAAAAQATWTIMQTPSGGAANSSTYTQRSAPSYRINAEAPAHDHSSSDESSLSLRSIADAKQRIRALELEANTMQQHFNQYRQYVSDHWSSTPGRSGNRSSESGHGARSSGLILNPATLENASYFTPIRDKYGDTGKVFSSQYTPPAPVNKWNAVPVKNQPTHYQQNSSVTYSERAKYQPLENAGVEIQATRNGIGSLPRSLHLELKEVHNGVVSPREVKPMNIIDGDHAENSGGHAAVFSAESHSEAVVES